MRYSANSLLESTSYQSFATYTSFDEETIKENVILEVNTLNTLLIL